MIVLAFSFDIHILKHDEKAGGISSREMEMLQTNDYLYECVCINFNPPIKFLEYFMYNKSAGKCTIVFVKPLSSCHTDTLSLNKYLCNV
jgi:hypothetical protein